MLRGLLMVATVVVASAIFGTLAILGSLVAPGAGVTNRLGRVWSRLCLLAAGIDPAYRGLEHAEAPSPRLFLANHLSVVDIWVLMLVLPDSCRFVAKRSLFWIPVIGQAMWVAGFIPIDRADRTQAIRSISRAAARIRKGASVILFPEGTRSRTGKLAPFKKGSFHLALETRVPIVPIAISGTGSVVRPRTIVVRPGPVTVTFFPPLDTAPYPTGDVAPLMERVRSTIATGLGPGELA